MAKVMIGQDGKKHLRNCLNGACLCGHEPKDGILLHDETLECKECAAVALAATELVTKAEKREWRKL